jgi:hypothetical protein|tara:strand:- start:508 stop:693 length:186 start_codon:yes stop_codon:yes gene_type:complete
MKTPYTITAAIWHDFRSVQKSGKMNMFGHRNIGYFTQHEAYDQALNHFEIFGFDEDLVIEG